MSTVSRRLLANPKHFLRFVQPHIMRNSSSSTSGNSLVMNSVISTASKGIGLEFARQLLALNTHPDSKVICLCRVPSVDLKELHAAHPVRVKIVDGVELESEDSIRKAGERICSLVDKVDLLLNVAAILGDGSKGQGPERSLSAIDPTWLRKSLDTNLVGHVLMTQALFPLLQAAGKKCKLEKNAGNDGNYYEPRVVNLSARVGSISDNHLGGWYSYRMSKTALNMFTRTFSLEAKRSGVHCISLHPGTVDTDLSTPFKSNVKKDKLFSPQYSVSAMLSVIQGICAEQTGKCYAYDGSEVPY